MSVGNMQTRDRERPQIQEMVVVHRVFRRELPASAQMVRATAPADVARARVVADHIDLMLRALDVHHRGEDKNLWPKLLERAKPQADLIARMEQQHGVVHGRLEHVQRLLPHWRRSPDAASSAELADAITALTAALTEHLDEEEAHILPLVTEHITVAEWNQLGDEGMGAFDKSELPAVLGSLLEDCDAAERKMMLHSAPAPVRWIIWPLIGKRQYARYVRRVREG